MAALKAIREKVTYVVEAVSILLLLRFIRPTSDFSLSDRVKLEPGGLRTNACVALTTTAEAWQGERGKLLPGGSTWRYLLSMDIDQVSRYIAAFFMHQDPLLGSITGAMQQYCA